MPELISVTPLFADGYHNAFTDLLHWKNHYYLSFRTAQHHTLPPNGDVLIYRSADLESWELSIRFDTGGDDRDPKLIDAGDRLGVVFGTWIPRWGDDTRTIRGAEHDLISHVATTRDGVSWSTPRQVYGVNYWLWRILPSSPDGFYCPAYHFGVRDDRDQRSVHLLFSEDLTEWRQRTVMRVGDGPGEPVLFHPEPGVLKCVVRTLEPDNHSWIGRSAAPYRDWEWMDLGVMIHAPVVLCLDGRWIVAGRSQAHDLPADVQVEDADGRGHHTSIWEIVDDRAVHLLTVPGCGDCSYCGIVHGPDGDLLMSYYSQHERYPLPRERPTPADVFLARIRL